MKPMKDFERAFVACPLVAILRGIRPHEVDEIGDTLVEAGFTIIEIPLNSPDALTSIARLASRFGDEVIVGAGTVLTSEEARAVATSGGRIVVSPNMNPAVIRTTVAAGMISAPGYFTPTEAFAALDAGAHLLKLFPASQADPSTLRAHRSVLPKDARILVTGGVEPETLKPWHAAGARGFGLGSSLYSAGKSRAEVAASASAFMTALEGVYSAT